MRPGVIRTDLVRHMNPVIRAGMSVLGPVFLKTIPQGAATQCLCAVHPAAVALTGNYFADSNLADCRADGNDAALARKLWAVSEKISA